MWQQFIVYTLTFYNLGTTIDVDSPWLTSENEELKDVCLTKECIVSAATILENVDLRVNPCDDFYQFACGGYEEKTLAAEFQSVNLELHESMQAQLKELIERSKTPNTGSFFKLKALYDSCMNVAHLEELSLRPLNDILNSYGGWPVVLDSKWDENNFDWKSVISEIIGDGISVNLLEASVELNRGDINSEKHSIPMIGVMGFLLHNSSFINETHVKPLLEVAVLLGASAEKAQQEMEELFLFSNTLTELYESNDDENTNDICITNQTENEEKYNPTSIRELYNITDKLDWLSFLQNAFSSSLTMESEIVCIGSSEKFARLIEIFDNSPKRVQANYLISGVVRYLMRSILPEKWDDIITNAREGSIPSRSISRWRTCISTTDDYFSPIIISVLVRHTYRSNEKENIKTMFSLIQTEFKRSFESAKWLNNKTLQWIKQKIDDLNIFLVYDDKILDDKYLVEYYREVPISPYEFFKNIWQLKKFQYKKKVEEIYRAKHREIQVYLLGSNANYHPTFNRIEIPFAQGRELFFSMNRPQALNFGSLGGIIGHEITHILSFIEYEKQWSAEDIKAFRQQVKCIIDQYERYSLPKIEKQNGSKTVGEDVADNIGTLISYKAYQFWLKDHPGSETRLPGLNFNYNQLFWMNFANVWSYCSSYSFTRSFPPYDIYHSWPKFRVWGVVSNSPEFSKDFNCPLHSAMNPEAKCSIIS